MKAIKWTGAGAILAFIRGGAERSAAWKLWIKFVTGSIFVNKVKI